MTSHSRPVRTRFAPSPTGFLHIGGARTALFSWAFARHHGGKFVLRIEDTDLARSTPQAVQAILDGMQWLGLEYDEGPFYQTKRMARYREVIDQMLANGTAYRCYTRAEELEQLREAQRARGEKPRYDGRWRPEAGKTLPAPPADVPPVIRFRNPTDGVVAWNDLAKGRIEISNAELDDFIIARADGTPTYNFCVVVDDLDMNITHVIRGDDHVNNTPRQINLLAALGAEIPQYAHLSMILGDDGAKLSKRHGAVSVMQYHEDGYLPDAVINYLARLGWSHGDDEIFSRQQLCEWFSLERLTPSAAQFNTEKLDWLNAHYIKHAAAATLAADCRERLAARGIATDAPALEALVALYQERTSRLTTLADEIAAYYQDPRQREDYAALVAEHFSDGARAALAELQTALTALPDGQWQAEALSATIKTILKARGLKMPQLAIPLRIALLGKTHTPSIDAVLAAMGRDAVLARLQAALQE